MGAENYFAGEGEFIGVRPGRHQWETNFVPDLSAFELKAWAARGAGGSMLRFMLSDSTIGAHSSEMPVGTYQKGHRHFDGVCVFAVTGKGYSLLWREGDPDYTRVDWEHGCVYCPPDSMFHQHFNTGTTPSRYLAFKHEVVSIRNSQGVPKAWISKRVGGDQIDYVDEKPVIKTMFKEELAKVGLEPKMDEAYKTELETLPPKVA